MVTTVAWLLLPAFSQSYSENPFQRLEERHIENIEFSEEKGASTLKIVNKELKIRNSQLFKILALLNKSIIKNNSNWHSSKDPRGKAPPITYSKV